VENLGDGFYKNDVNKATNMLKEKIYVLIDEFQEQQKQKDPEKSFKRIEHVLYLDSDVDVNGPITPFISSIGPSWDSSCNAYMFHERWYTRTAYSTVIMLLHRTRSADLLEGWGKVIAQHPEFPRDHLALSLFLARDGQQEERKDEGKEFKLNKICELPLKGGMTYGSDFVAKLRGTHATTFTHSSGHENVVNPLAKCD
jgi:hypothetical protein